MPTSHRTNDYTTPSLALTNGSTFGELLFNIRLPSFDRVFDLLITFVRIFVRSYLASCVCITEFVRTFEGTFESSFV